MLDSYQPHQLPALSPATSRTARRSGSSTDRIRISLRETAYARPCQVWHSCGMNRIRLSTTVDADLLDSARGLGLGSTDAALVDEALRALLVRYRSAEVDASYAAYDEHPVAEPDEWGDLASWRRAAATS